MHPSSPVARQAFAAFFGVLLFLADLGPAAADASLESDMRPAELEELSHELSIQIDGLFARVTATQRIANQNRAERLAIYEFELPASAAITKLSVTLANGRKARSIAVDATAAITAVPDSESIDAPPDPGLLRLVQVDPTAGVNRYEVRVWPVAAGRHVTIERTWVQPVAYQDGRVRLRLPGRGDAANLVKRKVSVSIRAPGGATGIASVFGGGKRLAKKTGPKTGKLLFVESAAGDLNVEATPLFKDGAAPRAEYTAVRTGETGGVVALSVVVPRTTGESFAAFENVVIAVDVSRSMGKGGVAAAAEIADAILSTSDPGAQVEVVLFDRGARRVFGKLIHNSRDARSVLATALTELKLQNGSDLGKAVEQIKSIVESTPAHGHTDTNVARGARAATLVAVISDGMSPVGMAADEAVSLFGGMALAESEVVSITVVPDKAPVPDHSDDALSELVRLSSGRAIAVRHSEARTRGRLVLAELTRANALEELSAETDSSDTATLRLPRRLAPGDGIVAFGSFAGKFPKRVSIRASSGDVVLQFSARRGSKARAKSVRAMALSQIVLGERATALERRELVASIEAEPVVGRHTSLVALDHRDGFARDRMATIKKWGSGQFRRLVSPTERSRTADPLELAQIVDRDREAPALTRWRPRRATGELGKAMIERLISLHVIPKARACYEKEIRGDHGLRGDVTLRVEMARGEVQFAEIARSDLSSAAVERCVVDAAYSIPVPKVAQGDALEVTYLARYPLRFRVRAKQGEVGLGDPAAPPKKLDGALDADPTDPLGGMPKD